MSTAASKTKTLKATEFLFLCEDVAMAGLPAGFPALERRVMWTMLQLHCGDEDIHFELQPHVGRGQVELGLHFEASVEVNDRWADCVADRAHPLMAALGDGWELEEWTPSWRRLHRVFRFERLTAELARTIAEQFIALLVALQPMVAEQTGRAGMTRRAVRDEATGGTTAAYAGAGSTKA